MFNIEDIKHHIYGEMRVELCSKQIDMNIDKQIERQIGIYINRII